MSHSIRITTLFALLTAALVSTPALAAKPEIYTGLFGDLALKGYDAVAYFEAGKPLKGDKQFSHQWKGAEWRFSSAENRMAFIANPEAYAPQYGGYCAWAVSQGSTASADPKVWAIVEGKLYVNYNKKIGKRWDADKHRLIELADRAWPKVLD